MYKIWIFTCRRTNVPSFNNCDGALTYLAYRHELLPLDAKTTLPVSRGILCTPRIVRKKDVISLFKQSIVYSLEFMKEGHRNPAINDWRRDADDASMFCYGVFPSADVVAAERRDNTARTVLKRKLHTMLSVDGTDVTLMEDQQGDRVCIGRCNRKMNKGDVLLRWNADNPPQFINYKNSKGRTLQYELVPVSEGVACCNAGGDYRTQQLYGVTLTKEVQQAEAINIE